MNMVKNQEEVTKIFGYWPQFCDGEFLSFSYEKASTITAKILYIDNDQSKKAVITIVFSGVNEIQLNDLFTNNYIDEISITDSSPHTITIEGCYGLNGSFQCKGIEVINVST